MAFKTDTIKLDFNIANDVAAEAESPENGTLALVGNAGSKQLLLRDNGSWGSVLGDSLVTSLSDLSDVGESPSTSSENEVAFLYDNAGNLELRFQKLTVDNLSSTNFLSVSDLSDTNTPSPLSAPDVGKVLGVVLGGGVVSSMTFDYSASVDGVDVGGLLTFGAGGNNYQIFFDGTYNTTQSVNFVYDVNDDTYEGIVGSSGLRAIGDVFVDLETLLNNTFGASGFTISSTSDSVVMTADSAGVNAGITNLTFVNAQNNLAVTLVAGVDPGYQYELVVQSGGIGEIVSDTTPQLGGTLDANGNEIDMGTNLITDVKVGEWDLAYGWGDHSTEGYLTSETSHADVVEDGDFTSAGLMTRGASSGQYSITPDNSANWDTAYGWGDHSVEGYLTSTDTENVNYIQTISPASNLSLPVATTANDVLYMNTADWGSQSLLISDGDLYGDNIRITIINASTYDMGIGRTGTGSWTYSIHQLGLSSQTSFTLEAYQKAILAYTGVALVWDVVILPA